MEFLGGKWAKDTTFVISCSERSPENTVGTGQVFGTEGLEKYRYPVVPGTELLVSIVSRAFLTINVPLFKKLRDIIFFWWDNHFMSHFSGHFEGASTFLTPKLSLAYFLRWPRVNIPLLCKCGIFVGG
jgi:hypothetical protein